MTLSDGGVENGSGRLNCEEVFCDRIMNFAETRVTFNDTTHFKDTLVLKDTGEVACKQVSIVGATWSHSYSR